MSSLASFAHLPSTHSATLFAQHVTLHVWGGILVLKVVSTLCSAVSWFAMSGTAATQRCSCNLAWCSAQILTQPAHPAVHAVVQTTWQTGAFCSGEPPAVLSVLAPLQVSKLQQSLVSRSQDLVM